MSETHEVKGGVVILLFSSGLCVHFAGFSVGMTLMMMFVTMMFTMMAVSVVRVMAAVMVVSAMAMVTSTMSMSSSTVVFAAVVVFAKLVRLVLVLEPAAFQLDQVGLAIEGPNVLLIVLLL